MLLRRRLLQTSNRASDVLILVPQIAHGGCSEAQCSSKLSSEIIAPSQSQHTRGGCWSSVCYMTEDMVSTHFRRVEMQNILGRAQTRE